MNEEIKAAMATDKPVMIFNIERVGQMNPSATIVNNHYWGDDFVPVQGQDGVFSGAVKRKPASAKVTPKSKPQHKSTLPRLNAKSATEKSRERMTFMKRGILDAHVRLLFQKMIELDWISKDNDEQDFLDLFSGELSDCRITWGTKFGKSTLVFLFKYFETEGVIAVGQGYTIPNILMGHFVDQEGNYLTNLDNGDAPAPKSGKDSEDLLKVLKINASRQGRRAARIDHSADDFLDDDYTSY